MDDRVLDQAIPRHAVRFWGLNPLFWTHIKLFVKDVLALTDYSDFKGVYCYSDTLPIMRVEILGYIVSVDRREKLTTYGVDDGSGAIPCCQWQSSTVNKKEQYDLGQRVTVQGKVSTFREQRQLTVELIHEQLDPNSEVLFWLEAMHLGKVEYKKPFDLPPNIFHGQANIGEISKEEELRRAVANHLRNKQIIAFQFRTFCLEPDILHLAREVVKVQGNKLESSYEERKVIRQVIKNLEKEGMVYFKDSKTDLYEVISHEHNLGPAILKAIRKLSVPSDSSASVWAIMDVLHSSHKFHYVTLNQVEDSLDRLLQSSDVYRESEHKYRLV